MAFGIRNGWKIMDIQKLKYVRPNVQVVYGEYPPNFDKIKATFPMAGASTVYAYGERIFVPSGEEIEPEILAHEMVHCERQLSMGIAEWWDKYMADEQFRLAEEVLAHQVEYSFLRGLYPGACRKKEILDHVAGKLSHPLYGSMCGMKRARELVKR